MGIARNEIHDLETATDELIDSLGEGNPRLSKATGGYRRASVGGRPGLQTTLENVSEVTGRPEVIQLVTAQMRDGHLFYTIAVAPEDDVRVYQPVFRRIVSSIKFAR
jgi:hypothetical protein